MIKPIPPQAIFIIGSFLIPFLKGKIKSLYMLLLPVFAFMSLLSMPKGKYWIYKFMNYDLIFGRVDGLSMIFLYIFVIISFIAIIYALHVDDDIQHVAAFNYAGGALGVTLAGDLFTLYLFCEAAVNALVERISFLI